MYKITFKGIDVDSILVEDGVAKKIMDELKSSVTSRISIGGNLYQTSSIKSVASHSESLRTSEDHQRDLQDTRNDIDTEYMKYRKTLQALSIDERAQRKHVPSMVWFGSTGSFEIPEESFKLIVERSKKFFKENPHNIFADPTCYKDVVKKRRVEFNSPFRMGAMHLVEGLIRTDYAYAKREKNEV